MSEKPSDGGRLRQAAFRLDTSTQKPTAGASARLRELAYTTGRHRVRDAQAATA